MMTSDRQHKIVGLTGGIGSGKTQASDYFHQLGVAIVDTDCLARQALAADSPLLLPLREHFAHHPAAGRLFNAQGELIRAVLREIIFQDPQQKLWLEKLIHPWVEAQAYAALQTSLAQAQRVKSYMILSSPLLLECGQDAWVDRVLVIDVPESIQLARTAQRDGLTEDGVGHIMAQQFSRLARLAQADDLLDNSADRTHLYRQIETLHLFYCQCFNH